MIPKEEDRGSFYTELIPKERVPVIIQTDTSRIHGLVHANPNVRLKDYLNNLEDWLAVTDAKVFDPNGEKQILESEFLALHLDKITWIVPMDEVSGMEDQEENTQPE
jgi:hypothetical protein